MGREVDIDNAMRHLPLSVRCARAQHIAERYWLELVKVTGGLTGHRESLGRTPRLKVLCFNGQSWDVIINDGVA